MFFSGLACCLAGSHHDAMRCDATRCVAFCVCERKNVADAIGRLGDDDTDNDGSETPSVEDRGGVQGWGSRKTVLVVSAPDGF